MLLTGLLVVVAAAPKAPAAEKLDALDFTNGTMLVKESESYSTGVGSWAAWRLADGSPTGWCSASGKTAGSFEWELDGSWALDTDATNTDAYNLDLSNRRAAAVVKWLTEHGVKATQLSAKGFGKTSPVADNATAQGRALNRRVEVSLAK